MGPRVHNRSIFDPKISIFLRYTHITPIFGVRRIRPNGILSPPYAEVTLDNFGFPVGGRLATRRAVFQPPGQNLTIDKWFFDRKSFFLKLSLKLIEVLWKAMVRVKLSHFVWFFVHFYKLIRLPPGPLWGVGRGYQPNKKKTFLCLVLGKGGQKKQKKTDK